MAKVDMSELFASMAREERPPEGVALREQRRARVVGSMRELHVRLVHERAPGFSARRMGRWLLIAATLALASTALARVGGLGSWMRPSTPEKPPAGARPNPAGAAAPTVAQAAAPRAHESAPAASEEPPLEPRPAATIASSTRGHVVGRSPASPTAASDLEAVNRLFAEARHARREGRDAAALALVDQLLGKYPHSVLAQEASVERFRALAKLGRIAEARRQAESYLARYHGGFATEEAQRLLANPVVR